MRTHRQERTGEKVRIMSCLQEISRNVDANALALSLEIPALHLPPYLSCIPPSSRLDPSLNFGQKSLISSNGMKRMKEFCDFVFTQENDVVIVAGSISLALSLSVYVCVFSISLTLSFST